MAAGRALCVAVLLGAVSGAPARAAEPRELLVFAASSLREAFGDLGTAFQRSHPGTKVVLSLAGSQELRTQVENGAPADVLAFADERHMQALVAQGLAASPRTFARNEPVIVVPKHDSARITSFGDLPKARRIVLGAPEVPIGAYALRILDAAGARYGSGFRAAVEARIVSREPNVRQVIAKVALGEADAAIVYRTDAAVFTTSVDTVPIPPELDVVAEYPVAVAAKAKEPDLARQFVELLLSPAGQDILLRHGFRSGTRG
jgi:molybdate transport system substrate-binding protein